MTQVEQELIAKATKLEGLLRQMIRHETLNKSDMPFVVEILTRELYCTVIAAKNVHYMNRSNQNDTD